MDSLRGRYTKFLSRLMLTCLMIALLVGCSAAQSDKGIDKGAVAAANKSSQSTQAKVTRFMDGVQFTVPADWKEERADGKYFFTTPDNTMTVIVYTPSDPSMEAAMVEVDARIKNKRNTDADQTTTENADEIRTQNWYGTGEVGNARVAWIMTMVGTDGNPLAILTYGQLDKNEKAAGLNQLLASLRRIGKE